MTELHIRSSNWHGDINRLHDAVREAGKIALSYFGQSPRTEKKPDGSEVSEADLAVDALLKRRLLDGNPGDGWLSEESEDDPARFDCKRVWIVDPIDGTQAFIKEVPEWTISAALIVDDKPVLAAVYNPVKEEFFEATLGMGARLNGQKITVGERQDITKARVITNQSTLRKAGLSDKAHNAEVLWVNSIAYRLCLVASGWADATFSFSGKNEWDIAAADLIVYEAGGTVTDKLGQTYTYNAPMPRHSGVIAANSRLHEALLDAIKCAPL